MDAKSLLVGLDGRVMATAYDHFEGHELARFHVRGASVTHTFATEDCAPPPMFIESVCGRQFQRSRCSFDVGVCAKSPICTNCSRNKTFASELVVS